MLRWCEYHTNDEDLKTIVREFFGPPREDLSGTSTAEIRAFLAYVCTMGAALLFLGENCAPHLKILRERETTLLEFWCALMHSSTGWSLNQTMSPEDAGAFAVHVTTEGSLPLYNDPRYAGRVAERVVAASASGSRHLGGLRETHCVSWPELPVCVRDLVWKLVWTGDTPWPADSREEVEDIWRSYFRGPCPRQADFLLEEIDPHHLTGIHQQDILDRFAMAAVTLSDAVFDESMFHDFVRLKDVLRDLTRGDVVEMAVATASCAIRGTLSESQLEALEQHDQYEQIKQHMGRVSAAVEDLE